MSAAADKTAESEGFNMQFGGMRLFRVNDIVDLPIIEKTSGQRICTVKDVIVDTRENRVYALLCRERLIKRSCEIIPYDDVISITQNYVMIAGKTGVLRQKRTISRRSRYQGLDDILGKLVINKRGEILGIIRDLLINSDNGRIIAYELSEGYLDDLVTGRRIVEFDGNYNLSSKSMVMEDCSPSNYMYYN